MANHKSSIKRIRNSESKRVRNRYQAKTLRNAIKNFLEVSDKKDATGKLPKLASMLDRLAKTKVIHKNKASNLKSELASHINHLK
jgi:small subunit ribosomal protein S20